MAFVISVSIPIPIPMPRFQFRGLQMNIYPLSSKHDTENLLMLCVPNAIFTLSPSYFIPDTFLTKQNIFIILMFYFLATLLSICLAFLSPRASSFAKHDIFHLNLTNYRTEAHFISSFILLKSFSVNFLQNFESFEYSHNSKISLSI